VLLSSASPTLATAKIADLGLARPLRRDAESMTAGLLGTAPYLAPEMYLGACMSRGDAPRQMRARVDARCVDTYAFGITLTYMCTRERPWRSDRLMMPLLAKSPVLGPVTAAWGHSDLEYERDSTHDSTAPVPVPVPPPPAAPFQLSAMELLNEALCGNRPALPPNVPRSLQELIAACVAHDPSHRPSFATIGEQLRACTPSTSQLNAVLPAAAAATFAATVPEASVGGSPPDSLSAAAESVSSTAGTMHTDSPSVLSPAMQSLLVVPSGEVSCCMDAMDRCSYGTTASEL